jgi:hypothetical protein
MAMQTETVGTMTSDRLNVPVISPARLSWGAIFGGTVAALSLWVLLYSLGLALGLSTVDPDDPAGSFRSSGIFTGIYGLIAPLIALFVGGLVAGRVSGVFEKGSDVIHGLLMWGMTTLLGTWLVMTVLGSLLSGAASAGKAALAAGGAAVGALAQGVEGAADLPGAVGVDAEDALAPINQRLRAEGKPAITAAQLQNTIRDAAQQSVRQGRVDRNTLTQSIAQNTALSQRDASELAGRLEAQLNQARSRIAEGARSAGQAAQQGAAKAADATGKAFWGVFGALLLGLAAAMAGARVGMNYGRRLFGEVERPSSPPVLREQSGHA